MVAVAAGKASRRGEILNDLPDRVSDVIIFVGVAHSGLMNPMFGYWAAIVAAICFWKSGEIRWLLVVAPLFCYLRLWFNMLDGMVAVAAGKASRRGEILNDLPDRISDVIIFVGVAHSGLMNPIFSYWATIAALLTAYVGLFGQALGVQREFGGIMSKPWRMVALHIGAWLEFLSYRSFGGFTILDWTCFIVIAGCVQTIVVRLKRIAAALQDKR